MKLIASIVILFLAAPVALAHGDEDHKHTLLIEGAWAPHTGGRTMSAAIYMTIKNEGNEADALLSASTPVAGMSMLHESKEVDGVMVMDHVETLAIPAGGQAYLARGSYHIMLMRLNEPLKKGEVFPVTLTFEKAGDVTVTVEITGVGGPK